MWLATTACLSPLRGLSIFFPCSLELTPQAIRLSPIRGSLGETEDRRAGTTNGVVLSHQRES